MRELALAARALRRASTLAPKKRRRDEMQRSDTGNRLVRATVVEAPPAVADGARIVDMALMAESLAPHMVCPLCARKGRLVLSRRHETTHGLAARPRQHARLVVSDVLRRRHVRHPASRSQPRPPGRCAPTRRLPESDAAREGPANARRRDARGAHASGRRTGQWRRRVPVRARDGVLSVYVLSSANFGRPI